MKLIVGLGNPGREYVNTRHNIGFMVLDKYTEENNLVFEKTKFSGLFVEKKINNDKIIFLKPQKYMNLSGEVIKKFVDFYKIETTDILIIHDDLDIELGKYKLRIKGSCAGHNGLRDIENNLGTDEYRRLKIGISNPRDRETKDYVLGNISKEEKEILKPIFKTAISIIDDFLNLTFEGLMNKYNNN